MVYYESDEDLYDECESYPESEEDAEDPDQASVVEKLLPVGRFCLCRQCCIKTSSSVVRMPLCTECRP